LVVGTITRQCSDTVPEGNVISQSPLPAQVVNKGTSVNITVSTGPCPITVPNLVGMTEQDARTKILISGLTLGTVKEEYSDTVPKGSVISQSPEAGSKVPKDTPVNLVISKGKKRSFIVSCGTNNSTNTSNTGDMIMLGILSGLLLLQSRKGRRIQN